MARTIAEIQTSILQEKLAHPELNGLNSPSQVSIYNLWSYVVAVAIWTEESLWDIFKTNLETDIANAPVGTEKWVQDQTLKFQYSTTNPQIVELVNFVPGYTVVDPTLKIISRASVKTLPNRSVAIKVATGTPPNALNALQLSSLSSYLDEISFAGVNYAVNSQPADRLMVGATIWYNGQYSSVISNNVQLAINDYMAGLPFDGFVRLSKLEDAIQAVAGVNDVVLNNISIRASITPFVNTTYMVQNNTEIFNKYTMYAGYAIPEDNAGYTLTDTLIFKPE